MSGQIIDYTTSRLSDNWNILLEMSDTYDHWDSFISMFFDNTDGTEGNVPMKMVVERAWTLPSDYTVLRYLYIPPGDYTIRFVNTDDHSPYMHECRYRLGQYYDGKTGIQWTDMRGVNGKIPNSNNVNNVYRDFNDKNEYTVEEPTEPATAGGDPVIKPFFGSGYKVKLPDLPGHVYRLLQGGGVTINTEIMACPADKACFLRNCPVLFSDQKIIEGTYLGKILIDVKDISFRHTINLSQGIGCVECNLPDGASWDGDVTDGEIKQGVDPDYKGKYKQRIMSVGGGVMKFVVRIYEHPQVQNEFRVLRCNIDPSVQDGLLMRNYKPKLFFLNDLYDTRILSKHKKNSNPLTFRHPVVKNQVTMKCA